MKRKLIIRKVNAIQVTVNIMIFEDMSSRTRTNTSQIIIFLIIINLIYRINGRSVKYCTICVVRGLCTHVTRNLTK